MNTVQRVVPCRAQARVSQAQKRENGAVLSGQGRRGVGVKIGRGGDGRADLVVETGVC